MSAHVHSFVLDGGARDGPWQQGRCACGATDWFWVQLVGSASPKERPSGWYHHGTYRQKERRHDERPAN